MLKALQTREFWLVVIGAVAAICKALNVPMVDALVAQYGDVWAGLLALQVAGKVLKPGQAPFVPAPPVAMLAILGLFLMAPAPASAGNSVWQGINIGLGGQGVWNEQGAAGEPREFEAFIAPSLSITPHVSLVGEGQYGFVGSYFGAAGGVRLTATDVENQAFSVGIGVSRYYNSDPGEGLNEAAGEAVLGWVPVPDRPVVIQVKSAYGLDSGAFQFRLALKYFPKKVR